MILSKEMVQSWLCKVSIEYKIAKMTSSGHLSAVANDEEDGRSYVCVAAYVGTHSQISLVPDT